MNQGIYKLVFSKVLNMMVPVSEAARGHVTKSGRRARQPSKHGLKFSLMLSFVMVGNVWADTQLPAGISIKGIVGDSTKILNSSVNHITFQQLKPSAIVDFNTLNLSRGQNFNVNMNANWSMLSRIHDTNPSLLNGNVNAAGNLYFINANGIIIGKDAQFNVGSLYAGTLNMTDELFQAGFVNDQTFTKAFELVGTLDLPDAAKAKIDNAQVLVDGGAQITTTDNGKVLLFAPNVTVEKQGVVTDTQGVIQRDAQGNVIMRETLIRTPEGQTILAAGKKVYLKSSKDPAGFLVEVDGGGTATNLGKIVAERGNITMMGLAVNQLGTLSATTSVRANGSIMLLAQDNVQVIGQDVIGRRNGYVKLGQGSVTEVKPDYADKEESTSTLTNADPDLQFKTSEAKIEASLVHIDGEISVKGGNVTVDTQKNASFTASSALKFNVKGELDLLTPPPNTPEDEKPKPSVSQRRIFLGDNARIDVSGVHAEAPMSRNQLEIQLFSDQLKDAPILRDSGLFRETVYVDARKGTDLFDIQPFLDLVGTTVAEKMTKAGRVNLATPNDLIISKGAVIDVSGGSTTYTAGEVKESTLLYNGKLVPISEAKPDVKYDRIADTNIIIDPKWGTMTVNELPSLVRQVQSYVIGDDAGTVDLTTPIETQLTQNLLIEGKLIANTTVSKEQLLTQKLPKKGELIASAKQLSIASQAKALPLIKQSIAGVDVTLPLNFNQAIPNAGMYQSVISADFLASGFNRINFSKVETLSIDTALNVLPHGELTFGDDASGFTTKINANILAPNSNINFQSLMTQIADNVTISTAGIFTNDSANIAGALTREVAADGGNITAGILKLGNNVTLDASAGAWVDNNRQFHAGEAGDISFISAQNLTAAQRLLSYGFNQGGVLSIDFVNLDSNNNLLASTLNIANNRTNGFSVANDFFSLGGFSGFALSAFNVDIGSQGAAAQQVYGVAKNWDMQSGFTNFASGQAMSVVAKPITLPAYARSAVSFDFASKRFGDDLGTLNLAENTTLRTDRGGSVTLAAGKQVNVMGDILTPSGHISIGINDADIDLAEDTTQAVYIGEKANLNAAGTVVALPSASAKLAPKQVFNAGRISINPRVEGADTQKGAVIIKQGAVLDVSGVTAVNDIKTIKGQYIQETQHGDAGSISIVGTSAMLLDGSFNANANGTGRDGSLDLVFKAKPNSSNASLPAGTGTFVVTNNQQLTSTGFNAGDAYKTLNNQTDPVEVIGDTQYLTAQISAAQIEQGGFANVRIKSFLDQAGTQDRIELANGLDLAVAGNLTLESPVVHVQNNGNAQLSAGHMTFKSPNSPPVDMNTPRDAAALGIDAGTGNLTVQAKQVYVDGLTAISGTDQVNINAALDIHGQGQRSFVQDGQVASDAGLIANQNITLTARQVYPDSGAHLSFEALGAGSQVTINSNGAAAKPVLSAGGTLNIKADDVLQNGVLTAPFGQINLIGKNSVKLTPKSITSIAGSSQNIPFGITSTAGEKFNPAGGNTRALIQKLINIASKNVDLQKDAILDLSAGGDMFAYEWVEGIGGSQDVLAQANTYAITPTLGAEYAPRDLVYNNSSAQVGVGQAVYLSGIPGLAAGTYTLLPARYALVPGAYLVQSNISTQALPGEAIAQQDGSVLTAGYLADISTGARDANWSTFRVQDGAVFRPEVGTVSKAPSQYILTSANEFFSNPLKAEGRDINLPQDAGKLSLNTQQLNLDATVLANRLTGGDGLAVDISANAIRVVSNKDAADSQSLQLTASALNALNAESVLLGGTRSVGEDETLINTVADTVSIENDAANSITNIPELIATAKDSIVVKAGASINTGEATKTPQTTALKTTGEGALLALSSSDTLSYSRTGATATATQGQLSIETNSNLNAGNSLILDASKNVNLAGNVAVKDGGSVTLGANRILIGDAPAAIQGLNVNATSLAALGQLSTLTLNSYSNIDTFGAIGFGNNQLDLTLNAAGIVGHLGADEVSAPANAAASVINANTLTIKNTQDAVLASSADNAGRGLTINANTVRFEGEDQPVLVSGQLAQTDKTLIQGYSQLNINADEIRVAKQGEIGLNVADTTLNAGRITAETGATYTINASGTLATTQGTGTLAANNQFGGRLTIAANQLTVGSTIEARAGQVTLQSNQDLTLAQGARVAATSHAINYYDTTQQLDAGKVNLTSTTGNVNVNANAVVDVTSVAEADAGSVNISASNGTATIAGDLLGSANGSGTGGKLKMDVQSLANLTATNNRASGFDDQRHYRVRTGDVEIAGTGAKALKARDISVAADTGSINVSGEIVATAPKHSQIGLYAGNGLTLESTARLAANTTQAGAEGGRVELFTATNSLDLRAGSTINVSGGVGGAGGEVHLRAPRTGAGSGNGVAVNNLATAINGAQATVLEAFRLYNNVSTVTTGTGTAATLGFTTLSNDVNNFMANKANILASLGKADDASFYLRAGTEIRATNNLRLASDWNLSTTRGGDEPGILTLRAQDNLTLSGSLSDGFVSALANSALASGESWSYRIIAGADYAAADVLTTRSAALAEGVGNISLAANEFIRTGTGSIDIAAGGHLSMGNNAAIYTAGQTADDLAGFDLPASTLRPTYLTQGGDITIQTQGNIEGAETGSNRQLINQWLFRQGGGSANLDTTWWVRPDLFRQGVATLGGGNVHVQAGGDISNFSASAPTTGRFDNFGTADDAATFNQRIDGGGDVTVQAGGNINNGTYFVAKGSGTLEAGGAIQHDEVGSTYGTVLALQDGSFDVRGNKNVAIETVLNPTFTSQWITNLTQVSNRTGLNSYFNSYAPTAQANITSTSGDVALAGDNVISSTGLDNSIANSLYYLPGDISIAAHAGSASIGDVSLMPAANGNLSIVAANDIKLGNINMSDADPASLPTVNRPLSRNDGFTNIVFDQLLTHSQDLLHKNDNVPVRIVANTGDIYAVDNAVISLPKVAKFVAGNDIRALNIAIQNNKSDDISVVKAGNDVNTQNITVSGPGELLVQAGRNIDLVYPNVTTITTTGAAASTQSVFGPTPAANANPALPAEGASITLQAGLGKGAATQAYIDQYILPTGKGPATIADNPGRLAEYKAATALALTNYMRKLTGNTGLSTADALTAFNALNEEGKIVFANRHLTSELITSAQDFAKAGNHLRGNGAIATLFPTLNQGDILLFNSKISTNSGGSIDMLAPGGLINVGVPGQGGDDIGIITEKGGAIYAVADGDFQVNQSKVITQFGSDIAIWSTNGTIDAGRGSKSATSVPERLVQTDAFGNTTIEVRGVAAGSGIRAQSYDPDGPNKPRKEPNKGNVYLTAPRVDAGEAGIEAGDLLIVAPIVLNAANIQVQGTSSGVPAAATSGLAGVNTGLSPDAVNSATKAVSQSVAQSANNSLVKPALPSIISVDVISIGN